MALDSNRTKLVILAVIACVYILSDQVLGLRQMRSETFHNLTRPSYTDVAKLLRDKITAPGYDRWVRPNEMGKAVEVLVEMKIVSFGKVREDEMDYTLDIFFRQWWTDDRLAHDIDKVFNMAANPADYFWIPDTYFVNGKSSNFHHVTRDNMRVMIKPDGRIYYSTRVTLTASCEMNLSMFPMDTQICLLKIESYAYTIEDVIYNWNNRGDSSIEIYAAEMAQFDMKEVRTMKLESSNSKGSFDSLRVIFKFKRRSSYFFVQHYIPSSFIVLISWLSFWINKNAVPARVSLTVTCVLSTMVLFESINSSLPRVSYLKAIDYYLIVSFFFILASMVEYCFVLNIEEKSSETSRKSSLQSCIITDVMDMENHAQNQTRERFPTLSRPRREATKLPNGFPGNASSSTRVAGTPKESKNQQQNYQFGEILPPECFHQGEKVTHFIDSYSRKVFPLLYILFNIGYWSYFLPKVN